ncbi:MAG: hypothetical protein ACLQB4_07750 [Beijerinckiaceae bacterium]
MHHLPAYDLVNAPCQGGFAQDQVPVFVLVTSQNGTATEPGLLFGE